MKFKTRTKTYEASNVAFDVNKIEAKSYGWYTFVRVIKGKVIFNSHRYSNTTARHQFKVRRLLAELGIKIDRDVDVRESLSAIRDLKHLALAQKHQAAVVAEREEFKRFERNKRARERRAAIRAK